MILTNQNTFPLSSGSDSDWRTRHLLALSSHPAGQGRVFTERRLIKNLSCIDLWWVFVYFAETLRHLARRESSQLTLYWTVSTAHFSPAWEQISAGGCLQTPGLTRGAYFKENKQKLEDFQLKPTKLDFNFRLHKKMRKIGKKILLTLSDFLCFLAVKSWEKNKKLRN